MSSNKKIIAFAVLGLFVVTGTYNSVVINSKSSISDSEMKSVKRLDEVFGVTVPGRKIAVSSSWKKIDPSQVVAKMAVPAEGNQKLVQAMPADSSDKNEPQAFIQDTLNLNLVEVSSPKWKKNLSPSEFSGSIATNNGVIEDLTVSLPNGQGISVSFAEMNANVFEYELNGELYSGVMYQVDQNSYMVTLTNGPFQETRLRFSTALTEEQQQETEAVLAQNNVEVGSFGQKQIEPEAILQNEQGQEDAVQAQGFNMDNSQAM